MVLVTVTFGGAASAQFGTGSGTGAVVTTEQVRAELMAHAPQGADPGKIVWVGLQLAHKPEWHRSEERRVGKECA